MEGLGEETPVYFICPISLQIMEDPVTLCTGMTYDRKSIESWFSAYDRDTCPVTNLPIGADRNVIPNMTLERLIHAWKAGKTAARKRSGESKVFDVSDAVGDVVRELQQPHLRMKTLGKIKGMMVQEGNVDGDHDDGHHDEEEVGVRVRVSMEKSGITALVASLASRSRLQEMMTPSTSTSTSGMRVLNRSTSSGLIDEATSVLRLMDPSPTTLKKLAELKDGELIGSLSTTLQRGRCKARIDAAFLIKSALKVVDDNYKSKPPRDLIDGAIDILKDQNSDKTTTRAALSILMQLAQYGRNRSKEVESGAVAVLIELLVEEMADRRKCEAMLGLLGMLCGRAEGRAALLEHPAGVAAVVGKMIKVSHTATEMALKVLMLLCKYCGGVAAEEILMVGGVGRLYTVLQVGRGSEAGDMARVIFGLQLRSWTKFPCFPNNCII